MENKKIVEKSNKGDLICQWVDEVLPLGEDRKTIFVPMPAVTKFHSQLDDLIAQSRAEMFGLMAILMSTLAAKFGEEVWEATEKVMYDLGYQRGKEVASTMKIDPTDARSIGRILDLEDSSTGVKGEWVETGKKRAVKHEFYCPFAEVAAVCPDICTRLFAVLERGTFDAIGAKVKDFKLTKIMPKGDPYCEAVIELEE
jgi:predicted ArsR family transcriptional regulator